MLGAAVVLWQSEVSNTQSLLSDRYLTFTQASDLTGRSRSAVRRFVDKITADDGHDDRDMVRPSPDEVAKIKKSGGQYSWTVREDFLVKHLGAAEAKQTENAEPDSTAKSTTGTSGGTGEVDALRMTVDLLRRELDEKNKQLAATNERQRESNVLLKEALSRNKDQAERLGELESKLLLTDGQSKKGSRGSRDRWWRRPIFPRSR